jgi:holo-[acyl-carrier protein] synthase
MKSFEKIGIGVDIEEVLKFRKFKTGWRDSFLNKVFTSAELKYCFSKVNPAQHLAVRWAAKEAVIKALAETGMPDFKMMNVEIGKKGKVPIAKLIERKTKNTEIRLSMSHDDKQAIAFAIVVCYRQERKVF